MKSFSRVLMGTMVLAVIAVAGYANATFLPKDSADFAWKYEMDQFPSDQDLDGNSVMDFSAWSLNSGTGSLADSVLSMNYPSPNNYYAQTSAPGGIWTSGGITAATGYTVEAKVKLTSSTGSMGGYIMYFSPSDGHPAMASLSIAGTTTYWGTEPWNAISLDQNNNLDNQFHTYRIAQTPGTGIYSVWRDGVLLSDSMLTANANNSYTLGDFGAPSGVIHGSADVEYFRLTPGAYAPVPEPSTVLLLATGVIGLLAYAWRKRK
jgi:hypothetical protein